MHTQLRQATFKVFLNSRLWTVQATEETQVVTEVTCPQHSTMLCRRELKRKVTTLTPLWTEPATTTPRRWFSSPNRTPKCQPRTQLLWHKLWPSSPFLFALKPTSLPSNSTPRVLSNPAVAISWTIVSLSSATPQMPGSSETLGVLVGVKAATSESPELPRLGNPESVVSTTNLSSPTISSDREIFFFF